MARSPQSKCHRSGRDNDPGGLGDMPDSQGPNMAEKPIGTGVSGPSFQPGVSSQWHKYRKGNNQWMHIPCMLIGHFPSSSYSPTYVGS